MDGIHDLGGMQGFGPVDVDHGGHVTMADWENRMWAIARTTGAPDWTVDWWRHITERLPPHVYLDVPYFEKWMLTYTTGFITSGVFSAEDLLADRDPTANSPDAPRHDLTEVLEQLRNGTSSTRKDIPDAPRFTVGQPVRTQADVYADHTRLPRYARGRTGTIIAHHGAYLLPDLNARGVKKHEHHYTVSFTAKELWGAEASAVDTVKLDLWESYLVQTG
ncbi:nitrile hydratase, beta subunit [Rhodobacteraceae bacterium KLH11]|nr:nitrile hydratase, beta subunit [Rhodobacteraceae bacterium KLH11]